MTCNERISNSETGYSVVIDGNDRVVYAYLINKDEKIVGDVWLYNLCESPRIPEWTSRDSMPFANSVEYAKDLDSYLELIEVSKFIVQWERSVQDKVMAKILIENVLFAVLIEDEKPGYSILAKKNGPLAKVLIDELSS